MSKPKILIPQDLPEIFVAAKGEANWLIFAIGAPDEKGKKPKRPIARDKPYIPTNRDKAASFTYDNAVERMRQFADGDTFGDLAEINRKHRDYLDGREKAGKPMDIEGYALGYFCREDSALVALDFDECVHERQVEDFEIAALMEASEAYAEISSSGTGLRVMMPREWGDTTWPTGEKNGVGLQGNDKGAAFAITFDIFRNGKGRDQDLVDLALTRRQSVPSQHKQDREVSEPIQDQVLEHGRVELKTFLEEILPLVKNDDRFDGYNEWHGMIRGAKEYYELVEPDGLEELYEGLELWCESWDGDHDPDKLKDVWDREGRKDAVAGLGSWIHYAQEAGFEWVRDDYEVPEGGLPKPVGVVMSRREAYDRFVLVNDRFYDRYKRELLDRGNSGLVNSVARAFTEGKEQTKPMAADKIVMLMRHKVMVFTDAQFMPGEPEVVDGVINLWAPLPRFAGGPPTPWIDHVRLLFGEYADTLMDWLAFVVQNPGKKVGFSPVLIGPQGCGKDTLLEPIVSVLGKYAIGNMNTAAFDDTHNGWIEQALLVVMQESVAGRLTKANVTEKLKTMIANTAGKTLPLRKMGQDTRQIPNVLNMAFLTNHIDTLHVERDDRRFWPLLTEVLPAEKWFDDLYRWLDAEGGREAVVGFLQRRKIKTVREGMRAPYSEFKERMIEASFPEGGLAVLDYLDDKKWVSTRMLRSYMEFTQDRWKMADRTLGAVLRQAGFVPAFGGEKVSVRKDEKVLHHRVWFRDNISGSGDNISLDLVKQALIEGGDKLERSQCYPKEGITSEFRDNIIPIE